MDLLQIVKREGGPEGGRQGEADGSLTLEKREPSLPLTFESVRLSDSIDFENDGSEWWYRARDFWTDGNALHEVDSISIPKIALNTSRLETYQIDEEGIGSYDNSSPVKG